MSTYIYWFPVPLQLFKYVEASELSIEIILEEVVPAVLRDM